MSDISVLSRDSNIFRSISRDHETFTNTVIRQTARRGRPLNREILLFDAVFAAENYPLDFACAQHYVDHMPNTVYRKQLMDIIADTEPGYSVLADIRTKHLARSLELEREIIKYMKDAYTAALTDFQHRE